LLITTLAEQLPATADPESTTTTLPVDTMLQEKVASEHTVALQLCEPKMKLLPDNVTVLPAYATEGTAELMVGLLLICNIEGPLVALVPEGFEKFTLTLQLAALSDSAAAIKILVLSKIEQLRAAAPQTAAEHTCAL
jgi:hypothetical protein